MATGGDEAQVSLRIDGPNSHIRISDGLHAELKLAAKANGRSMNAEIAARLEASFTKSSLAGEIAEIINRHVDTEVALRLRLIASKLADGSH